MNSKRAFPYQRSPLIILALVLLLSAACGPAETPGTAEPATVPVTIVASPVGGDESADQAAPYPGPAATDEPYPSNGYPGAAETGEQFFDEPPNPELTLPEAASGTGAVGGILIREVSGTGFTPFDPHELILAEVIRSEDGRGLLAYGDDSPRAETLPTGVFVFNNVPPGEYGLIVNLAIAEFPIRDESGNEVLINVEGGQAIDLGQVIVQMP